jgi:Cu/Ag efflux pump CusA
MPKFFIDRPVFAWVLSLFICLAGIMAILHLPVAEYPSVAPPSITITATYLGASAETVQNTVTEVIEEQMSGAATRPRSRQIHAQFPDVFHLVGHERQLQRHHAGQLYPVHFV